MKIFTSVFIVMALTGCAAKSINWISTQNNSSVTPEVLIKAKSSCDYDAKLKAAKDRAGDALSVSRYGKSSSSDSILQEAKDMHTKLMTCMRDNGVYYKK